MAAAAVGAEFTVVDVVGAMTIAATSIDGFDFCKGHTMTVVAADLDVSAIQREVGLQVVIKGPDFPRDGAMTGITAVTHIAFVRVIVSVAGNAIYGLVRVGLACMAAITFLFLVIAMQRESRQVMIKENRVLPVNLGMTAFTLRTEHAFMGVIIQMAGIATG
jgi:hypothetical protein